MANEVLIKFRVTQDGTLKMIGEQASEAAASTERLANARNRYSRGEKGVAGATSNSTKAFSKMRATIGSGDTGVVGAYAALAANVFAVSAAFGVLRRESQLQQLREGFDQLANSAGRSAEVIVAGIQRITDGAVSSTDAFRIAASGFSAGFSTTEIERLTKVARGASTALGRELTDALDRLVRGTAKLEPEILDELGIFIRLDDAARQYADSIGKVPSQLTQAERRQAFLNETLAQGELKFGAIASSVETNPYDKLAAAFDRISKSLIGFINTALGPLIQLFGDNQIALAGGLLLFAGSIKGKVFPVLDDLSAKYEKAAAFAEAKLADAAAAQSEAVSSATQRVTEDTPLGANTRFAALRLKILNEEETTLEELQEGENSLLRSIRRRTKEAEDYTDEEREALEVVKQQLAATQTLIAARTGELGITEELKNAERLADIESGVGKNIEDIQQGGVFEGFSKARAGVAEYRESLEEVAELTRRDFIPSNQLAERLLGTFGMTTEGTNDLLNRLALRFRFGSVAVRLFGAAFINAIPLIGQIIFAVGLLIQGIKSLTSLFYKQSDAQKTLNEIVESSGEKFDQLAKANENLTGKYLDALFAQEALKTSTKELNEERIRQIAIEAESRSKVEAYANTLRTSAGVTKEFSDAISAVGRELANDDIGFLDNLGSFFYSGIVSIVEGFKLAIQALSDGFKSLASSVVQAIPGLRLVRMVLAGAKEAAVEFGDFLAGKFPEFFRSFNVSGAVGQFREFKHTALNSFQELDERAQAGVLKSLGLEDQKAFKNFLDAQQSSIEGAKDGEDAQLKLRAAIARVEAELRKGAQSTQASADAILKFKENTQQADTAFRKFNRSVIDKNPFEDLGENLQQTVNAVNALKEQATDEISFAELLKANEANIDLKAYGLTLEEVQQKGADAFSPLQAQLAESAENFRSLKSEIASTKTELAGLKINQAYLESVEKLGNLSLGKLGTGRAVESIQDAFSDLTEEGVGVDRRLKAIEEEKKIKLNIIEQEKELELLKLDVLALTLKDNKEALALIQKQRNLIRGRAEDRSDQVGVQASTARNNVESDQLTGIDAVKDRLLGLSGDSTGDILGQVFQNFREQGPGIFDVLDGIGERIKFTTQALQPMIEGFKSLGPEGELGAAVAGFGVVVAEGFGSALQQIQQVNTETATAEEKMAVLSTVFGAVASSIGALASVMAAQSNAAIKAIDKQIEQEKKRDGKSQASQKRILEMEAKKEKMKKKAFETDKKLRLVQAVASTAAGIAGALSLAGKVPPGTEVALAAVIGALGAAQIAIISGLSYDGGGGQKPSVPNSISVGKRKEGTDLAKSQGGAGELAYFRGARGQGGPENFRPAFGGMKYRAAGGSTAFMVGEQGPEMFVPETPGRIVPSDDVQNGGTPVNATINISAVDAAGVEDVLMNQRGNIISMIRDAANAQGNTFLEEINVSEL